MRDNVREIPWSDRWGSSPLWEKHRQTRIGAIQRDDEIVQHRIKHTGQSYPGIIDDMFRDIHDRKIRDRGSRMIVHDAQGRTYYVIPAGAHG
jgi:hypothetical protein